MLLKFVNTTSSLLEEDTYGIYPGYSKLNVFKLPSIPNNGGLTHAQV